jgi:flagellar biosynthesis anti-sigma factor FlgM
MGIEINAPTSGGAEAGGSGPQSSMAETGTSGAQDHDQGPPPERQWAGHVAQGSPPEVRSERIAAIQAAIANGTYQVSPEQTADAILAEHLVRDESAA